MICIFYRIIVLGAIIIEGFRGRRERPPSLLSGIIFSFSCSFQDKIGQILSWHSPPRLGSPGSATDYYHRLSPCGCVFTCINPHAVHTYFIKGFQSYDAACW